MLIYRFKKVGGSEGIVGNWKNKFLNKCWYIDFKKTEVVWVVGN